MKKVVLLGDSIRLVGYGPLVPELLGEDYQVFQPEDNCRFVKYTLRGLFEWREDILGADIIHWNNGLWDTSTDLFDDGGKPFTCEEEYVSNMLRVAEELKKITPNVIFATTTPVRPDYEYNDNQVIARYNEALVPKLKEMGLEINDLHSLVNEHLYTIVFMDYPMIRTCLKNIICISNQAVQKLEMQRILSTLCLLSRIKSPRESMVNMIHMMMDFRLLMHNS